ncbi:MAG: hypothetical protein ACE5I1_08360 [bacterium]
MAKRNEGAPAAPTTARSQSAEDLKKKLEKLRKDAKEFQKVAEDATKKSENSNADVKELERVVKDTDALKEAYQKAFENSKKQQDEWEEYYKVKEKMIENALPPDERKKVDDIIAGFVTDKSNLENFIKGLETDIKDAQEDYNSARKTLDEKKQVFDAYMVQKKNIDDGLKAQKDLKVTIEDKDNAGEYAVMYFWVKEFDSKMTANKALLIAPNQYGKRLETAWLEFHNATNGARVAEKQLNDVKAQYTEKQQELNDMIANRIENILEEINALTP